MRRVDEAGGGGTVWDITRLPHGITLDITIWRDTNAERPTTDTTVQLGQTYDEARALGEQLLRAAEFGG